MRAVVWCHSICFALILKCDLIFDNTVGIWWLDGVHAKLSEIAAFLKFGRIWHYLLRRCAWDGLGVYYEAWLGSLGTLWAARIMASLNLLSPILILDVQRQHTALVLLLLLESPLSLMPAHWCIILSWTIKMSMLLGCDFSIRVEFIWYLHFVLGRVCNEVANLLAV